MILRFALASALSSASRRLSVSLALTSLVLGSSFTAQAAAPYDLLPLNPASPNYANVFSGVMINDTVAQSDTFKAGDEILSAVYAYLCSNSLVKNDTRYRERLFVLLDHRLGLAASNTGATSDNVGVADIGCMWQAAYAYMLMKHHCPTEISASRVSIYETGLTKNNAKIMTDSALFDQGLLADLWLNGDVRLAMSAYFGGLALGDSTTANKAQTAINGVMTKAWLGDGGTRYAGFWNEVPSYHEETIKPFIYWWKITGSVSVKAAIDATVRYSIVANEPSGFVEQSSNIPYKHMYNNRHNEPASLWKAYIYNDAYNFYYGQSKQTASSTELLNAILYQTPPPPQAPSNNVGVFFDKNIQGPRYRSPNFGWIVNGRDVQHGGPEEKAYSDAQGYQGLHCGKGTFVGAFTLGPVANNTSLKGALDTVCVEFKETTGDETEFNRGLHYRYLTQDENTGVITRRNFGTVSSTYRISKRTSNPATPNWDAGATPWIGQQLWVLTGERMIGLLQIVSDASSTVYGLDARLVFTGGRLGIMGSELPLTYPDSSSFAFGDLRAKIHANTFTANATSTMLPTRFPISSSPANDTFSALVRINDPTVNNTAGTLYTAGARRWIVLDFVRAGTPYATPVINVLQDNTTWAVLQFTEGNRKVRIVQNLTGAQHNYSGSFVVGATYAQTSLHRSWNGVVSTLAVTNGTATVADTIPAYGHMIAVNSNQADDHTNSVRASNEAYP